MAPHSRPLGASLSPLVIAAAGCVASSLLTSTTDAGEWWFRRKKNCETPPRTMHSLSEQAAHSVQAGLALQVRNGEILSRTIRSHHFEFVETTDELTLETRNTLSLHASGKAELERQARRQHQAGTVEIYVEACHDPAYVGTPAEIRAANEKRDAQQAKLVIDYLQQCLGCTAVTVLLIETPQVGQEGVEGMAAFRRGLRSFTSTVPGTFFSSSDPNAMGGYGGGGSGGTGTNDSGFFQLPGQPGPSYGMPSY